MNSHIWIGILVTSGIMLVSAIAVSSISDVSSASTQSNDIDIEKKSESMDAFFDDDTINVKNTGKYDLEISMFRFYDKLGVEVHRTIIPDMAGRVFGGALPIVGDTVLTSTDVYLQSQVPKSYAAADIGIDSFDELSGEILTKRGRTFPILYSEKPGDETGDGQSMIAGMGIQSRIILKENGGRITHGTGMEGVDASIKPYLQVASDTNFAATVLEGETELTYVIPEFWHEYDYDGSALIDITVEHPNILGYSESRDVIGSNSINDRDGIEVSGSGTSIIKLNDYASHRVILTGNVSAGTVKLITPTSIDFMTAPYGSHGFTIPSSLPATVGVDSTHYATASWTSGYTAYSQSCGCGDPHRRGCSYFYTAETLTPYSSSTTVTATISETDMGDHASITSLSGYSPTAPASSGSSVWASCQRYIGSGVEDGWVSGVTLALYDTLPAYTKITRISDFVEDYTFPEEQSYLYVQPNGGTVTIKAISNSQNIPFVEINKLPANIPYQIIKDGRTLITGMTSATGTIIIDSVDNVPNTVGLRLKIFPDSLSYRGEFSTVVFDNLNNQTIHIDTEDDKTYVVHAYTNIPVIGSITVTNLNLDDTLLLSYLNGNYTVGNAIKVPVIPGYSTINLTLNGVTTQLNYADVLGGTGIKIAEPATSTITNNDLDSRISSITATAGTPAFVIATSDGVISAIMSETISGAITITNTYTLQAIPPPPPPPQPRDPLEGFVEIHVNGVLIKTETLGINPNPAFSSRNTVSGTSALQSVTYTYADYALAGSASVDVNVGDFVEFYLYGKIFGEIDGYSPPGGFTIIGERGTATATVNIRSAHIQTSQ